MKQEEHDSKKANRVPIQFFADNGLAFAEVTGELDVVPTGKWNHPVYREMFAEKTLGNAP